MLFEHLAQIDDSALIANRKAAAVGAKRVRDRFGAFFANAQDAADRAARFALVADDIDAVLQDVVDEYGGNLDHISAVVRHSYGPGMEGPVNPASGMPGSTPAPGGMPTPGSQTCPQCGGPLINGSCPTCQGGTGAAGAAGGYGMNHSMPQTPSTGPILAKGAFCDECRGWKSGPNKSCVCDGASDDSAADESRDDDEPKESSVRAARPDLSINTHPIMHAEPLPDEPGKEGVSDIDGELAKAPSAVGAGEREVAASTKEAEALTTVDLPTGDDTALGGPSPKIDKGPSGDQNGWTLEPIDTQTDGSPHPTLDQDPTAKPEYDKDDFLDQTRAVTETVELDSAPDLMNDAGFAPGGEEHGPHTDTWSGKGGQAKPVTQTALSRRQANKWIQQRDNKYVIIQKGTGKVLSEHDSAQQAQDSFEAMEAHKHGTTDPDKNPIHTILEEHDGFLLPNQVEAALKDWTVG